MVVCDLGVRQYTMACGLSQPGVRDFLSDAAASGARVWYHAGMSFDKSTLATDIAKILISIDQGGAFNEQRLMVERHRQEWPELWALLDKLMYSVYVEDKFIQ
jgi:hypothetical protein